jgi:hypothetical protein
MVQTLYHQPHTIINLTLPFDNSDYDSAINILCKGNVMINGNGAVLDAVRHGFFFSVHVLGALALNSLTLQHGHATGRQVSVHLSFPPSHGPHSPLPSVLKGGEGGAIYNGGNLALDHTNFISCAVDTGVR